MTTVEETPGLEMLDRANAIFTALEGGAELTVAEIAAASGLPQSSTYRLIGTLCELGLLDAGSKRGLFRLGLYFVYAGGLMEHRLDLRNAARAAFYQDIAPTEWTFTLYVPRGTQAVCIERFDGPSVRSNAMRVGDSLPMYSGAGPRAILAALPPELQAATLDQIYVPAEDPTSHAEAGPPPRAALEAALAADRKRGYVVSDEEVARGVGAVAAPVYNHRGIVLGAVSLSYLRDVILAAHSPAPQAARQAAATMSRAFGFPSRE